MRIKSLKEKDEVWEGVGATHDAALKAAIAAHDEDWGEHHPWKQEHNDWDVFYRVERRNKNVVTIRAIIRESFRIQGDGGE